MRLFIALLLGASTLFAQTPPAVSRPAGPETVSFKSGDGLELTADLYVAGADKSKPFILLCHQAGSSRGEYRTIAPRLVKAGYHALALDQRSGRGMNGVANETAKRAQEAAKATGYVDARQDIVAALKWIRSKGYKGKLALWGSSYSSALALQIGASAKELSAVLAFAPGEYLAPQGSVGKEAAKLRLPVLIVSPEKERAQATALHDVIPSKKKEILVSADVVHGSRTLFLGRDPEPTWKTVLAFLKRHLD